MEDDDEYPPEVRAIVSMIESWLDGNHNKIDLDLSQDPIEFKQLTPALFTDDSSLDQLRSSFDRVALDKLPLPGLDDIPPQWEIYPQTRWSSFSQGITLDQYNPSTQILNFTVRTKFFAIDGDIPQVSVEPDGSIPKGTYLQVRRDIQGVIKIAAKLNFK